MVISPDIIGRRLRLALLLLLLASQGIANAHEQSAGHWLDSHLCSVCLIGQSLDAAVDGNSGVPQLPATCAAGLTQPVAVVLISLRKEYLARAPPASL